MKSISLATIAILTLLALSSGWVLAGEHDKAKKPPNILLVVSEDNGPELGCYGDPYVRTPVLDMTFSISAR